MLAVPARTDGWLRLKVSVPLVIGPAVAVSIQLVIHTGELSMAENMGMKPTEDDQPNLFG